MTIGYLSLARAGLLLLIAASACGDNGSNGASGEDGESGNPSSRRVGSAEVVYQYETPSIAPAIGSVAGSAIVEVDDGVFAVVGQNIVYVNRATMATTIVEKTSDRFYSSLATDEMYVYFATQQVGRRTIYEEKKADPSVPDGYVYRASRRPPFAVERLGAVDILTSDLNVADRMLTTCSTLGRNSASMAVLMPTDNPALTNSRFVGFNRYCSAAITYGGMTYAVVHNGSSEPPTLIMTAGGETTKLAVPALEHASRLAVYNGRLVALGGLSATFLSKAGAVEEVVTAPAKLGQLGQKQMGMLFPLRGPGWLWTQDPWGGDILGRCDGGGIYSGLTVTSGKELTQGVCSVRDVAIGTSDLWFIDQTDIGLDNTKRYRIMRLPSPIF